MIRLNWEIEPRLGPALVDPSQLELAVMNLVLNARDAMPSGGTINIRIANRSLPMATEDLEAGEFVVVTVADTGVGIPPELLSKVTEPFFSTKDIGKGTGLGLSTAYGFARQSGGTLRIDSAQGHGTSVEIWLPQATGAGELEESATESVTHHDLEKTAAGTATILLVDDSASLRNLTELDLADAGFEVVSAAGGAEALSMIEREPERFDVIVTDFAMPLMSGVEVIQYARNMRPSWPAVIITGYAEGEGIAKRPADVPLLTKPFSRQALLQAIASVARPRPEEEDTGGRAHYGSPHP
jgi:CheY-like chemotaxis protein